MRRGGNAVHTRKHEVVLVAISAFGGASLAIVASVFFDRARTQPEPLSSGPDINVQQLGDELVRRLINELPRDPVDADPAPASQRAATTVDDVLSERGAVTRRVPITSTDEEVFEVILKQFGQLDSRLSAIEAALREGKSIDPPPSAELMRSISIPRNWDALGMFYQRYVDDPIAAADVARFMNYSEVLRTYGPPTSMTRENMWYYRRGAKDDRAPDWIRFLFINGYVSNVQAGND